MIDSQLRVSGINDPIILAAFDAVPRENYVAGDQRAIAYVDRSLPLGEGRSLSAPLSQARLVSEAMPKPTDKTLLVGGGTGYLAAVLAPLVASLDVVEDDSRLAGVAGTKAGSWHNCPLNDGWKRGGPYDLIIIDGAVEDLPKSFAQQLADDGRIVTGTVDRGVTRVAVGRRSGKAIAMRPVADIAMPVLTAFAAAKGWSF
ncbi:protein-L-isoaspartate O-methyltransferase [Croceicoccus ponticola]|uniref:Protein-L-isoaspartate O-methyltransferase n=2 Tax=Croceicoccus ponticola TaxID=2217664 RepID=A0A437GYY7_9SPHN|nr:protein-L-isoaspartate O-methyltransferase [Croceicoccus ponticola]